MQASDLKLQKEGTQKKIQALLANLLPSNPGEDSRPQIVVDDYLDLPVEEFPGPSLTATAGSWLTSNWQTLVLIILVGVTLMSIRSFVASGSPGRNDAAFERGFDLPLDNAIDLELSSLTGSDGIAADEMGSGDSGSGLTGNEAKEARARFSTTGDDMRTELASLIRENPDVAASLLRTWMGDAA